MPVERPSLYNLLDNYEGPQTQKAKGFAFLRRGQSVFATVKPVIVKANHCPSFKDIRKHLCLTKQPVFVRPCPMFPRHGFVDSILVTKQVELNRLIKETVKQDPEAELIFSSYIDGELNLVLANGTLTIGEGNDGATSGKNCLSIPYNQWEPDEDWRKGAGITEESYLEFVKKPCFFPFITQIRNGPKLNCNSKNFVPYDFKRDEVTVVEIQENESLIQWETTCKNMPEKHIVWHPFGSLSSHYGVHCILNGIPYITGFPLEDAYFANKEIGDPDPEVFYQGYSDALNVPFTSAHDSNPVVFALYVLRNFSGFDLSNKDHCRMVGLACGYAVKYGTIASLGEYRYYFQNPRQSRTTYYGTLGQKTTEELFDKIPKAFARFNMANCGGSVGGLAWANATLATIRLHNAAVNRDIKRSIEFLNHVIHESHNGGKYLTKFISQELYDNRLFPIRMADVIKKYAEIEPGEPKQYPKINPMRDAVEWVRKKGFYIVEGNIRLDKDNSCGYLRLLLEGEEDRKNLKFLYNPKNKSRIDDRGNILVLMGFYEPDGIYWNEIEAKFGNLEELFCEKYPENPIKKPEPEETPFVNPFENLVSKTVSNVEESTTLVTKSIECLSEIPEGEMKIDLDAMEKEAETYAETQKLLDKLNNEGLLKIAAELDKLCGEPVIEIQKQIDWSYVQPNEEKVEDSNVTTPRLSVS